MRWLFRALLPAERVAPAVSLRTPFVDSSVSKKQTPKNHSPGECCFFFRAALPSRPVHRWRAWLLFFGSFDAKSPSTIFWQAEKILVKKFNTVFFWGGGAGQILGVNPGEVGISKWPLDPGEV
jgi:hypothetical protein